MRHKQTAAERGYNQAQGVLFRDTRLRRGMTQKKVARLMKMTQAQYSRVESGICGLSSWQRYKLGHVLCLLD